MKMEAENVKMKGENVRIEAENVRGSDEKYVMSLDVGTTTIRSMVYNKGGVVMGTAATPVRYYQVKSMIKNTVSATM